MTQLITLAYLVLKKSHFFFLKQSMAIPHSHVPHNKEWKSSVRVLNCFYKYNQQQMINY